MAWTRQRTDFKIDEFMRIIVQKGMIVTWESASDCPCIKINSAGQPDFNCSLCKGKGRYWYNPTFIQGIMTNINTQLRYENPGEIIAGTNYFTTLPNYQLGFWDRITNEHSTIRFSQIIEKGDPGGKDPLRFLPLEVLSLRTVSTVYTVNIDFEVDPEGYINWIPTGLEPNRGERYSVDYVMHPRWIVIDLINVLRDTYVKAKKPGITFQPLPVRALIRLEFYVDFKSGSIQT
jgi:hypothetical protein